VDKPFTVHGAKGSGSVIVEAALTLLGLAYDVVEAPALTSPSRDQRAEAVNPLRQVPALVLPGGEVLTESAAILIWLADRHPGARLAPTVADPRRGAFLRWMNFISAQIYALYWVRDEPSRLVDDAAAQMLVRARTAGRIAHCWGVMDALIEPGAYILGDELGVLDLYVSVISRWGPRRRRFYDVAPKMSSVVRRVDADPRLTALWAERFPFVDGWEGEVDGAA
jgi:GST-like protein